MFREMIITGATLLHNHHPEIDALNVFPVPDGDTGTNMSLTFTNGASEIERLDSNDVSEIAKKFSKGLLMGARGNSGVILSQIFRGVAKSFKGKSEVNVMDLAAAFEQGSKVAYKAVMRPVEGTILTVIREASEAGSAYVHEDMEIEEWFAYFVDAAQKSLDHTPELLPVLKEVGVVDSGGAGLVMVLTGFMMALAGEKIERADIDAGKAEENAALHNIEAAEAKKKFGFDVAVSFQIDEGKKKAFTKERFVNELERSGASDIDVIQKDDVAKLTLTTTKPGPVLDLAQRYGTLGRISIKNLNDVDFDEPDGEAEKKDMAMIAVAAGEGVKSTFLELNCDAVVAGGQTMNPATEDLVAAIRDANADHVFVLPNNSNIVMTAQTAANVLEGEVDVVVIPTKSIPQGLSACIMYNPEGTVEDNVNDMTEAIANVKTGQVTFAIKDTSIDGLEIKANNYMALCEKKIVACVPDKLDALKEALNGLIDDDSEVLTLICGEDVTDREKAKAEVYIAKNFPNAELDLVDGQQPVYSFIIGVE